MCPGPVDAITAVNTAALTAEADDLVAADQSGLLKEFRALAGAAAASTNIDAEKVRCFDESEEVLDARSFCVWQQDGDPVAGLLAFEVRQGDWFSRRVRFESLWKDGEAFRYLALNVGGLGTQGPFGPFCLVTARVTNGGRAVVVFPGDSLQRYTTPKQVDRGAVQREAAAWAARGPLSVIQRGTEAAATGRDGWDAVICRPDSYLEVVVGPPLPLADLDEIRLHRTTSTTYTSVRRGISRVNG